MKINRMNRIYSHFSPMIENDVEATNYLTVIDTYQAIGKSTLTMSLACHRLFSTCSASSASFPSFTKVSFRHVRNGVQENEHFQQIGFRTKLLTLLNRHDNRPACLLSVCLSRILLSFLSHALVISPTGKLYTLSNSVQHRLFCPTKEIN
jgi:hypothetical protein